MCGIYGYIGTPKDPKKVYKLMRTLAIVSETRGVDGTGFFSLYDDEVIMEKTNSRAKTFVKKSEHMKDTIINKKANLFVGHNRMASVGSTDNINNAHPILGDKLLMVHNGTDRETLEMVAEEGLIKKKNGETDSEAIMLLMEHKGVKEILPKIRNYSLVVFDYSNGSLYFARDVLKPMFVYDLRKTLGVRIFASTRAIAESAFKYCNIKFKEKKSFATKPYHLYEVDIESGEFTNKGRYKSITVQDIYERKQSKEVVPYSRHQDFNFGRRGYAAPVSPSKRFADHRDGCWSGGSKGGE